MSNSKFTFRTPSFEHLEPRDLALALDRHLPRLFDAHASLNATVVKAPAFAAGFATVSGSLSVLGSKLNIATGLTKVNNVTASVNTGSTPNSYTLSALPSPLTPGAIDVYVWQPTSSSVTTPVAATTAVIVHWTATGEAETTT